jgi:signal transduction histidine kinase
LRAAELERWLAHGGNAVPLLAFRLPALERTAWRSGLRAARAVERRAVVAFAAAARHVLRAADLTAHDRGSDVFLAALVAPTRTGGSAPAPLEVRSALARIVATVEHGARLDVDAGWTRYEPQATGGIAAAVERALVRGAQERERYAFFSALGHELRTPLASIRGYLETLLAEDVADAATRRRFVRIAHAEALRLGRLLEGMFEISLLDLTAAPAAFACGRLDAALSAAADACAAAAAGAGAQLELAPCAPLEVALDTDRLTLVLINVIANAVKHGRPGGRVVVAVDAAAPRSVTVTVDDDGPGIAPAQRERVFALGARGPTAAPGSGIGLALVRLLLERAGGRVDARESPAGGARFALTLRRAGGG